MKLFAKFISIITSPILISGPLSYALIYKSTLDSAYSLGWTFIALVFAGLIAMFVYYGVKKGFFSDYDVSKREQRTPLFIFTAVISVFFFLIVILLNGPRIILISIAALILGIIASDVINTRIKASMHLAVFVAFAFIAGLLYGGVFWIVLLFAPLVAWSRITLKRHTFAETIAGTLIGASLVLLIFFVVKYLIIIK